MTLPWPAKHTYMDLAFEILRRPHYDPTMSRLPIPSRSRDGEGGPKDETGIVTVTHKRCHNCCIPPFGNSPNSSLGRAIAGNRHAFLTLSFILWICPLPNPLTSQPNSKSLSIFLSSRIPKQSTTAKGPPAILTISSGLSLR